MLPSLKTERRSLQRVAPAPAAPGVLIVCRTHLAVAWVDDTGVSEISRFIAVPGAAPAPQEFLIADLVLTVCLPFEVEVSAALVPAQEPLAHALLARAHVVEERRRGIRTIAFSPPMSLQKYSDRRRPDRR